ncbi:MAG: two pore domain potassium channel family protein [Gemmatimonadales bacterium]|nr:MAG: two pore domain potassium channel family protein [Gemmatimonadales bacterium]
MNFLFLLVGAGLLSLVIVDLLWTTLWVDGGSGPISGRLSSVIWSGLRKIGPRGSRTLSLAGPIILSTTLFMWVALIWGGWTLIFAGDAGSLVNARVDEPVSWTGRIYFVAFSMFTMGNGDFYPAEGFWQIATSLTTASGMLFVTMGVSYVLSILGAVATKRSFASSVTGLGSRGEDLVAAGWDGKTLHGLDLPLSAVGSQLGKLVEQHRAYPVLHYYHSAASKDASAVAVAVLDEALTLIHAGVPADAQPERALVTGARSSVASYLDTLNSAFIEPAHDPPPRPDLHHLRASGVPTVQDDAFSVALADLEARRRKLLGMVHADAWEWPTVAGPIS